MIRDLGLEKYNYQKELYNLTDSQLELLLPKNIEDNNKKGLKKRAGFTLIEMVVVVTIIGIISGIAAIKYSKAQKIAKLNTDYANASVIATAANLYAETTDAKEITLDELKEKGYLQNIPKVQSNKAESFSISRESGKDGEDGSIIVKIGNKVFYPKEDKDEKTE